MPPAVIAAVKCTMRRPVTRAWLVAAAVAAAGGLAALTWYARGAGPDQLWRRAHEAIQAHQWDRAEAELEQLGRARSPTPEDWMLRAQLAMAREKVDEALADLAKIPDAHQLAPQAQATRGPARAAPEPAPRRRGGIPRRPGAGPGLVQAHRELIYIYGMQGRRAELDAQFRELAKLTPLTFDNVLHWGLMSHESWQPDQVTTELGRFVEADPTDRWSRLAWADSLRRIGRVDEAWQGARALAGHRTPRPGAPGATGPGAGRPPRPPRRCWPRARPTTRAWHGSGDAWRWAARRPVGLAPFHRGGRRRAGEPRRHAWAWPRRGPCSATRRRRSPTWKRRGVATRCSRSCDRRNRRGADRDVELFRKLGEACASDGRPDEARAWLALALAHDPLDAEAQRALFRLRAGAGRVETQATTGPSAADSP